MFVLCVCISWPLVDSSHGFLPWCFVQSATLLPYFSSLSILDGNFCVSYNMLTKLMLPCMCIIPFLKKIMPTVVIYVAVSVKFSIH